jgi:hypothetical protein
MILFPSAVDYIRIMNTNTVDNLLAGKPSYAKLPSLYQRAYMLVHETGTVRGEARFAAPREAAATPKIAITVDPRVHR